MSALPKQTRRKDFIKRLRELGWEGPFKASKGSGKGQSHPEFMEHPDRVPVLKLPNDHRQNEIGETLLKKLLEQAGISHERWLGIPEDDEPPTSS